MDESVIGGRYRLVRRLGSGAMGDVWLADDTLLHRPVAVKRVLAGAGPVSPTELNRLLREARLAARLNHPNAVAVYDVVIDAGQPYVIMEYVAGGTLADEIARAGRLPVDRVAEVGAAVADALGEAHSFGIAHRDVKPANIILTDRGTTKLADFGIARAAGDAHTTVSGTMIGTPAYVAPEVARGGEADAASDMWSLGVTLYTALEGRSPFQLGTDDSPLVVLGRVLSQPVNPPYHGARLTPVIMRLLDPDRANRPSAFQAAQLLRGNTPEPPTMQSWAPAPTPATMQRPVPAPLPGPSPWATSPPAPSPWTTSPPVPGFPPWEGSQPGPVPAGRPARNGTWLLAALALVVLVGGGVGAILLTNRGSQKQPAAQVGPATTAAQTPSPAQTQASAPQSSILPPTVTRVVTVSGVVPPPSTHSSAPSTARRSTVHPASAGRRVTVTGTNSGRTYHATIWAHDVISDCADHAYGAPMIRFLEEHPCEPTQRVLATLRLHGRTVALSVIETGFAGSPNSPYGVAAKFRKLELADNTGSINDLLREGSRIPGVAAGQIPFRETFQVLPQDQGVSIFDAWYVDGPKRDQIPALLNLESDLFLSGIASG